MDAKNELREFLTTRRARLTPEQASLRTYGTGSRRVPGLRREEVALLAGVSVDYYTRLERGNASGVSETVLESLARALQLDDVERAHLFDLARAQQANARRRRRTQPRIRPAVQQMLDAMTSVPALVGELSTRSETFRTLWAAHDVRKHDTGVNRFRHPVVGELTVSYEAMELAADPGLTMFVYTAEPGSKSEQALSLLGSWTATLDQEEDHADHEEQHRDRSGSE